MECSLEHGLQIRAMVDLMKVTVAISGEEQKFPGGTMGGNWRIDAVQGTTIAFEYEGPETTTIFDMPEGQTYTLRGARLDDTGNVLGVAVELGYTVGEDLAKLWVAGALSVKASPDG